MKKLDRLILKTKINIILTILWIIGCIVFWNNLDISVYEDYAKKSIETPKLSINVEAKNGYILNVIKEEPKDLETIQLSVSNDTYMKEYYQLALKINKSCVYDNLNIKINNESYALKDLLIFKDEKYNYFIVGENEIVAEEDLYEVGLFTRKSNFEELMAQDYMLDFVELSSIKA